MEEIKKLAEQRMGLKHDINELQKEIRKVEHETKERIIRAGRVELLSVNWNIILSRRMNVS